MDFQDLKKSLEISIKNLGIATENYKRVPSKGNLEKCHYYKLESDRLLSQCKRYLRIRHEMLTA